MQVFFCEHFLYFHNKRISLCFQSCLQELPACFENQLFLYTLLRTFLSRD